MAQRSLRYLAIRCFTSQGSAGFLGIPYSEGLSTRQKIKPLLEPLILGIAGGTQNQGFSGFCPVLRVSRLLLGFRISLPNSLDPAGGAALQDHQTQEPAHSTSWAIVPPQIVADIPAKTLHSRAGCR